MRSLLLIALLLAPATRALAQSDAFMVLEVEQAHGRSMRAVRAALAPTEPALRACGPRPDATMPTTALVSLAPDADAIARAVRNERVRIVGCYERALARSSTSAGAVTLHVDVAARGRFVARVLASALDEETGTCLSAVVRAMRITPLGEVEDDAFDLTLTFSPTE